MKTKLMILFGIFFNARKGQKLSNRLLDAQVKRKQYEKQNISS